ncbi:MAG: RNA-binding protein [candidate division WOR-3 bacterium]|nr:MAG: RNA-binding protein [candidate division WOR-3 bacterium]
MNIYVGNLSSEVTNDDLQKAFEAYGRVVSVNIIKDKFSGRSRGFGFVGMPNNSEAQAAIAGMNGQTLRGKELAVNEARPRSASSGGKKFGGGRKQGGGRRRSW